MNKVQDKKNQEAAEYAAAKHEEHKIEKNKTAQAMAIKKAQHDSKVKAEAKAEKARQAAKQERAKEVN